MLIDNYQKIFKDKNKVMAVFSHPDDADFFAGGTIARLCADGKEVRVVKMTSGNKGSKQSAFTEQDLIETREAEDRSAMRILGVKDENNVYLRLGDGEVDNSNSTIGLIVNQIRQFKPDLIITHNPEISIVRFTKDVSHVNHKDHRNTGQSTIDAVYPYSRDILFFPEQLKDTTSHSTHELLLTDSYSHPDEIFINITDTYSKRVEALKQHASQFAGDLAKDLSDMYTHSDNAEGNWERFRHVVVF
jgi:LmbE family N-acetylglucosaminyl deacetylase